MAKDLLYTGHWIPILVFVAQSKNTSVIISLATVQGNLFHSLGMRRSHMVHQCRCLTLVSATFVPRDITALPGSDLVCRRLPVAFLSGFPHNRSVPFPLLGRKRYWGSQVSCPGTWHSDPSLGSILNPLIWSPTDKSLSHQLPTPAQPSTTPSQHWQKVVVDSAH